MTTEFTYHGNSKTLQRFAQSIGASLQYGKLTIQKKEWTGLVQTVEVEKGLEFFSWDLKIEEDCTFLNYFDKNEAGTPHLFCYYLDPQFHSILTQSGTILKQHRNLPCSLILHNNASIAFNYKRGSSIQCLCIELSPEWLQRQDLVTIQERWERFHLKDGVSLTPLSKTEFFLAKEIYEDLLKGRNLLRIKSHAYGLLHHYLQNEDKEKSAKNETEDYSGILLKIEQKIQAHIFSAMPSINELSKEFYISASTLRRQFKKIYGANIYEYYIQLKMKHAIDLLKDKRTVTEVAYTLGYESTSHFIDMFKRHHGVNPGQVSAA